MRTTQIWSRRKPKVSNLTQEMQPWCQRYATARESRPRIQADKQPLVFFGRAGRRRSRDCAVGERGRRAFLNLSRRVNRGTALQSSYECSCHGRYERRFGVEAEFVKFTQERFKLIVSRDALLSRNGEGAYFRPYSFYSLLLLGRLFRAPPPCTVLRKDGRMLVHIIGDRLQRSGGVPAAPAFAPKLKLVEQRLSPCHDESIMEIGGVHRSACMLDSGFFRRKILERLLGGAGAPRTIMIDESHRAARELFGDAMSSIFDQFPIALNVGAPVFARVVSKRKAVICERIKGNFHRAETGPEALPINGPRCAGVQRLFP
jgi:hypothetical protein